MSDNVAILMFGYSQKDLTVGIYSRKCFDEIFSRTPNMVAILDIIIIYRPPNDAP